MQVEVLENEVDALAREVMRLRLMVHRVTQVLQWHDIESDKRGNSNSNSIKLYKNSSSALQKTNNVQKENGEESYNLPYTVHISDSNNVSNATLINTIKHMEKEIRQLKRRHHHRRKAHHRTHHEFSDNLSQQEQEQRTKEPLSASPHENNNNNSELEIQSKPQQEMVSSVTVNENTLAIKDGIKNVVGQQRPKLQERRQRRIKENELTNNNSANKDISNSAKSNNEEMKVKNEVQYLITSSTSVNATKSDTEIRNVNNKKCNGSELHQSNKGNDTQIFVSPYESKEALNREKHFAPTKNDALDRNNISNNSANNMHKHICSSDITNSRLNNTNTNASDVDSVKLEESDEDSTNSINDTAPFASTSNAAAAVSGITREDEVSAMTKNDNITTISINNKNIPAISPIVQALRAQTQKEKEKRQMQNTSHDTVSSSDDNDLNNVHYTLKHYVQGESKHSTQTPSAVDSSSGGAGTLQNKEPTVLHTANNKGLEHSYESSSSSSSSSSLSSTSPEVLAKLALQVTQQSITVKDKRKTQKAELEEAIKSKEMNESLNNELQAKKEPLTTNKSATDNETSVVKLSQKIGEENLLQNEQSKNVSSEEQAKLNHSHSQSSMKLASFKPNQMVASMRNNASASRSALERTNSRTAQIDKSLLSRLRFQITQSSDSDTSTSTTTNSSNENTETKRNSGNVRKTTSRDNIQGNNKSQSFNAVRGHNKSISKYIESKVESENNMMKHEDKNVQIANVNTQKRCNKVADCDNNSHSSRSSSSSSSSSNLTERDIEYKAQNKQEVEQVNPTTSVTTNGTNSADNAHHEIEEIKSTAYQPMTLETAKLLYGNALDSIQNTPTLLTNDEGTLVLEQEVKSAFNTPATSNITKPVQNFTAIQASHSSVNEKLSLSLQSKTLQSSFGGYDYNFGLDSSRSFFTPSL